MIYKIIFTYTEPATRQTNTFSGIKEGNTPAEAIYYFKRQYPRHEINIKEVKPI